MPDPAAASPATPQTSRGRYTKYRESARERVSTKDKDVKKTHVDWMGQTKSTKRTRPFFALFKEFFQTVRGHRGTMAAALCTVSVSTLLGLIPLYGTKLVFDNVLDTKPLPPAVARLGMPTEPRHLLAMVGLLMIGITVVSVIVNIWGRWQTTRITKRVQVSFRKRVFDHAVRLPLHRVYELKSGGVASILREDAGGVGELVFSMIYNPARAIVQLIGSLSALAFVNWKLLLGAILLLPTVWLTHKTWISRIRPIFRDIRNTRQRIDAHAAESFGGIRVSRAFGRRRAEGARFAGDNHYMARQELFAWWWMRGIDIAWSLLIPLASALLPRFGAGKARHHTPPLQAG